MLRERERESCYKEHCIQTGLIIHQGRISIDHM